MNKHIVFFNTPEIIVEGITAILYAKNINPIIKTHQHTEQLNTNLTKLSNAIVLVSSNISESDIKILTEIKNHKKNKWIGIIINSPNRTFLSLIDEQIYLSDTNTKIFSVINKCLNNKTKLNKNIPVNNLSDREIDVLKLLIEGKMNKEIAQKLNISIHTVISHRKNISQKLGIKSTAAMAIYAVANGIININDDLKLQ